MSPYPGFQIRKSVPIVRGLILRQPVRTMTGMCGVAIACLLMFVQLGLRNGLFDQSVRFHQTLQADLVMLSRDSTSLATMRSFPRQHLAQVFGHASVKNISFMRIRPLRWQNQVNHMSRNILAIGVDPDRPPLSLPLSDDYRESLKGLFNVLFDSHSRREFGPIAERVRLGKRVSSEVLGHQLTVTGLVSIGPSFAYDGYLVASVPTVEALIQDGTQGDAELGLIQLKTGESPTRVLEQIRPQLPTDVIVMSKQDYIKYEQQYWQRSTAIGFIFNFGTILGLLVGAVMIYQVLYTDVSDHLSEYATLRAMGYSMPYLYIVVIQQGFWLTVLGFLPSLVLGSLAYNLIRKATNIGVVFSSDIIISVLYLTCCASTLSALLVTRRLWSADPAEIF